MLQTPFSRLQETVRASAEIRRECVDTAPRARAQSVEAGAASRKASLSHAS
jgi:hypothetical protein